MLSIMQTVSLMHEGVGAVSASSPGKQRSKLISEKWDMRHSKDEIEDRLPYPHGRKQQIEEHTSNQTDLHILSRAPDEYP
jgi:hypothetical protein